MITFRALALAFLLAACSGCQGVACETISLADWPTERIALPPEFAPKMPKGEELLRFAPGMFDAEAEDFWSYVFVMRIEDRHMDAETLTQLLEDYYDGLILAVGGGSEKVGADPASVSLTRTDEGRYEAEIHLIDAFETMEAIDLRVLIQSEGDGAGGTVLRVKVSPQGEGHEIWRALECAAQSLATPL